MDKLACPYSGIRFSNKKEPPNDTHSSMDESQNYYAEWKKPVDTKLHFVYFHLKEVLEQAQIIYAENKIRAWVVWGLRVGTDYKGA